MNKRQKIIVSITGIFIVLLALVGLTYAYFLTQIRGNEETKSISVTTANLILEYDDHNGIVTKENLMPGDFIKPKKFNVTNKGNKTVEDFNIYLENVINQFSRKEDLTYTITCDDITDNVLNPCDEFEVVSNEVNSDGEVIFPSVMSVIARDTLEPATEDTPAEVHRYTIKVKYKNHEDIDQSIDMNKQVQAKVNIYDGKTKFLTTEILNNAKASTSTKYVEPNMLGIEENTTVPGTVVSLENERILSYTMDNLGTSYFYRGNVNDNYVNFAGMCWRIVRIEGDGSVKLILEDQYTTCDDTTDSDGEATTDNAFTGNWNIGKGNYGYIYNSSDDQYFMSYLQPVDNADTSMIKAFYDFQTTRLKDYTNKLKSGNWCLGDKPYTRESNSDYYEFIPLSSLNYSLGDISYDSYVRLSGYNKNGYLPTLKCNGTVMNSFESVEYNEEEIVTEVPMYVSAITADEVVYIGLNFGVQTNLDIENNYLVNDYQKNINSNFWTISPATYNLNDKVYFVRPTYKTGSAVVNVVNPYFRPMVSLKSTSTVTTKTVATNGEPGTINNPYNVE